MPENRHGAVRIHLTPPPHLQQGWSDIELWLDHGRVQLPKETAMVERPAAIVRCAPLALCDRLLGVGGEGLQIERGAELSDAAIATLRDAVPPPARSETAPKQRPQRPDGPRSGDQGAR
ncbi:MAG: hypothetical protein ACYCXW_05185 [Solirubrobacteraceae bacterium]